MQQTLSDFIASPVFIIWAVAIGAIIGSLGMAVADRKGLPRGRSKCDHCGQELKARDLVPVLSWIASRGRSSCCQKPISSRYPISEAAMALVVALLAIHVRAMELEPMATLVLFTASAALAAVGSVLAIVDFRTMTLPNRANAMFLALAVVYACASDYYNAGDIYDSLRGGLVMLVMFLVMYLLSRGKWIGFGDVKLAPALGLLVGPIGSVVTVAVSSYIALAYAFALYVQSGKGRARHNWRKVQLPYGPFLLLATLIVYLNLDRIERFFSW